ncbi:MAG: hypothetical protein M1836_001204 [Candelina mexicana]|nr:MAG: hypothetical protein M1836_001204 [Candelina mexicana]
MCFISFRRYAKCGCMCGSAVHQLCDKARNRPHWTDPIRCDPETELDRDDDEKYVDVDYCPKHRAILEDRIEDQYLKDLDAILQLEAYHRSTIGARAAAALVKEGKERRRLEKEAAVWRLYSDDVELCYDHEKERWVIVSEFLDAWDWFLGSWVEE